ncbi:carboxypeptidase-like regulatory domain-containing protein [Carboxylicivirga sp. N1Y90]|uniref:carboxypeptidase-like regulatory domain-containing protein n=1 Tax=Carboxylicivirga fragile TaxID=3417571 RepID=UPI003D33BBE3|nr:carboxypeptidase-like regulatory domain-containing protein [Marinilabiliaceae bacterium N1Y90]
MQRRILKSAIILSVLGFICVSTLVAQNIEVKGRIVDAETNKAVEFANLGIVNSYMGTASDFNGDFNLLVSQDFENNLVRISAVGYKVRELTLKELYDLAPEPLKLFPQSYGINQVEVKAASKRLYGILKTASNVISDNYSDAYSSKVYFSQTVNGANTSELALNFSDETGYVDRSYSNAFEKRSYEVKELRRNFEPTPIIKGMLFTDEVLEFDVARIRGNVLDADVVDQFELSLKEEIVYNNDSVWVIAYSLKEADFATTGGSELTDYEGTIYVSQSDYAILRNELSYTSGGFHLAGRSAGLSSNENGDYKVSIRVDYRKKKDGKYALSKIEYLGKEMGKLKLELSWVVYDYSEKQISSVSSREYYSAKESDSKFWEKFKLPSN